jgi:hypothetical protein
MAIWSILQLFGIVGDRWVYFMVIGYIFPVLVCCTKKNLATLLSRKILVSKIRATKMYLPGLPDFSWYNIPKIYQMT